MSVLQISIFQVILGLIVLTTGLKLHWFYAAVIFFVFGMYVLMDLLHMKTRWLIQVIGLAVGLFGLVLGIYMPHITIVAVCFISGGYGSYYLAQLLGTKSGVLRWILFILGGILGIILVSIRFEWAVILLSSWGGATLVGKHIPPKPSIAMVVFLALTLLGVIVQAATLGVMGI